MLRFSFPPLTPLVFPPGIESTSLNHGEMRDRKIFRTAGARNAPLRSGRTVYEADGGTPPLQPKTESGARGEAPEQAGFEGARRWANIAAGVTFLPLANIHINNDIQAFYLQTIDNRGKLLYNNLTVFP